ncbi:hypothetical protein CARUB_v10021651mg, partial [Capsella rubella]
MVDNHTKTVTLPCSHIVYLRLIRYPVGGRINSYSRPEYLLDIVDVLDGSLEFEWLKQSSFGRFLQLPLRRSSLSGKLVHHVLCRSLITKKRHELWFIYGGQPICFSMREFAILTGLICNPYPPEEEIKKMQTPRAKDEHYWTSLFGPHSSVTIRDIVNWLKRDKKFPKQRRMVKDINTFDSFPWGRLSFERTLATVSFGSAIDSPDVLAQKLMQSHSATHGFTLAIQLLILQSNPLLQRYLVDANDKQTFTVRYVSQLTMLKTFHNSNILETEMDKNLNEVEGDGVTFILDKLRDGHMFKVEDWHGGVSNLPSIAKSPKKAEPTVGGKHKKPPLTKQRVDVPSSPIYQPIPEDSPNTGRVGSKLSEELLDEDEAIEEPLLGIQIFWMSSTMFFSDLTRSRVWNNNPTGRTKILST